MKYFGYYYIFIPFLFSFVFFNCSEFGDPEVKGCTNPDACNYNSDAMDDDGSCEVPTACDTCADNAVVTNGALDICDTCVNDAIVNIDQDDCGECGGDNSSCVNYSSEIQPILSSNCIGCHPNSGGLNLSSYADLMEMKLSYMIDL